MFLNQRLVLLTEFIAYYMQKKCTLPFINHMFEDFLKKKKNHMSKDRLSKNQKLMQRLVDYLLN